ncbi:hypothetical protein MPER_08609, partial [Moniliophthora perniciosa FA553]
IAKISGPHNTYARAEHPRRWRDLRPQNTQLYTKETEDLGVEGGLGLSLFEEWWAAYLKK